LLIIEKRTIPSKQGSIYSNSFFKINY